ncbi:MAG TPA: hypothetical protein VFL29_03170 [Candidatus Dormibacteraeota bacterium]|nr:hypothetical protein [Candidatus Dormibacteraeota bacterium]
MATVDAVEDAGAPRERSDSLPPWLRWWLAGTPLDWGFAALSSVFVAAGYYDSWVNRNLPVKIWEDAPAQAAWLAITAYVVGAGLLAWRRDRRPQALIPDGYGLSMAGCGLFLLGILINGWWSDAFGLEFGVPALFRPPNILEIAGSVLIVLGPLRSSASRGELTASPTAIVSAVMLLASVTFVTQFLHPYVDPYASVALAPPPSTFDQFDYKEEILGALSLLLQTMVVTGVVLWTLRQTRLPFGTITLMLTVSALFVSLQKSQPRFVLVALVVGVIVDAALAIARPRADSVLSLRLLAVLLGLLLSGVYLALIAYSPGTWWPADMTYGTILACGLLGGLVSFVVFPGGDAMRSASVLWPALDQSSSPEAPDVTVERVEHALKVLHTSRDLADNPLIGMRCLAGHTPAELRKTIEAAIEHLRSSGFQQDAQAGQILDLYYVRRIGGHYAVEVRVGLSRAAYFNRRSYGVRRLVDRLRELEESAAPA